MLEQPLYEVRDLAQLREIVRGNAWAMLVTGAGSSGPVVSHLPVLLEEGRDDLSVVSHVARDDAALHELGQHDVALVFQGPNGYVSPSFYEAAPYVPTWNFVVLHLHGRPELLDAEATYDVLDATVEHFESQRAEPWRLDRVTEYARRIAVHTVGFRMTPHRVVGKAKLSQDKEPAIVDRVIAALDEDPHHANPVLADVMRRAHRVGPGA
ncbi:FMN-binding negative transcriptional regulator [Egicoccus sp. AB-alg6-2]|uniref:FMN-binding negative transcriptional regulator n=1 Tax=Egicoccus sp. AB-alg6-2 TaxID=3242692 RepID=UPI00359D3C36